MFSLIIVILSIALVAALALSTVYYGGQAFENGGEKAQTARILAESQQLSGALTVFKAHTGEAVAELSELVDAGYLKSVPAGGWQIVDGGIARTDLTENQCLLANQQKGINTVPSCSDPAYASVEVCCSAD